MKLWHTTFYDSEIKLKQLYTKICHRLPAYSCKLYVVKEIVNQGKIQVKEVLSQRNPLKKVSYIYIHIFIYYSLCISSIG